MSKRRRPGVMLGRSANPGELAGRAQRICQNNAELLHVLQERSCLVLTIWRRRVDSDQLGANTCHLFRPVMSPPIRHVLVLSLQSAMTKQAEQLLSPKWNANRAAIWPC